MDFYNVKGGVTTNFVKYWRKKRKKSQVNVSEYAKVNQSFLSQIESGLANPSYDTLVRIAQALDVTIGELIEGPSEDNTIEGTNNIQSYSTSDTIPLLASIPAGNWQEWIDDYPPGVSEDSVPRYDLKGKHIFAIRVTGDSMEDVLHDGDILIIDPEKHFVPRKKGRIGVVKFNGEFKIRNVRLTPDGGNYFLEPFNRDYDPEIVPINRTFVFKIVELRKGMGGLF